MSDVVEETLRAQAWQFHDHYQHMRVERNHAVDWVRELVTCLKSLGYRENKLVAARAATWLREFDRPRKEQSVAYFQDLTPYRYFDHHAPSAGYLSVGWLANDQPFQTGETSAEFRAALAYLHHGHQEMQTRGWHSCPFGCQRSSSAEVRAIGNDGTKYAAPDMVLHYVFEHEYLPPPEFVTAVIETAARLRALPPDQRRLRSVEA